jgi:hypothetical protein
VQETRDLRQALTIRRVMRQEFTRLHKMLFDVVRHDPSAHDAVRVRVGPAHPHPDMDRRHPLPLEPRIRSQSFASCERADLFFLGAQRQFYVGT